MKNTLLAIKYSSNKLEILNQILLPQKFIYEDCSTCEKAFDAIKKMKVRGAPAIAITALLALVCELQDTLFISNKIMTSFIYEKLNYLCQSRPTAVNLFKMAEDLSKLVSLNAEHPELKEMVIQFAEKFFEDDVNTNKSIGSYGAEELLSTNSDNLNVLTHCNTGSLATAGYGTALGVIRKLHELGKLNHAYATETRPYNQGARLTAFELAYEKIPSTLITDSMVSFLMKSKKIHAVVVGADRVAANGDTANKIGTYQLAVAAAFHNIPFYVAAPCTSIDLNTKCGDEIHIEQRPKSEVTHVQNIQIAADGIDVWNPSFDITPANLISGIITENGVIKKNGRNEFSINEFYKK